MEFHLRENGIRTSFEYGQLDISGDEANGFRPFQLMVSSIAGCSLGVFRKILDKQRMNYEDIQVSAEVTRNPDEANRIEKIHLHFVVKGYHLNQDKLLKNLEISRSNCSMVQSVENSINVEETLECIQLS
ncbi:OsmC family peroxiredoxin [Halobacillus litoralis]|uniref:OsmC family peroxiredoxin n=1 Tax=Halobacillus litoralis TaxID=45668 RepID=A0A845DXW4_9BACI|nr:MULTISPECIES: OsmC family protein [Halobacillus]MCA1022333.1 OsmC family protein [Halobacillus litoralis]MYL21295.1 OsmC family peroxiredoxin [Halobacillus litoralis]MYL30261.1 OsmC family peroxiredoxin [Halobacillus halophilus]MYL38253.1 OsmC family peroxiredoxin [Halobacillus litoralis]